jgi:tripartite-type tricarboxylate transporter receptor subunit TctC
MSSWIGLVAPAGTPKEIVAKIHDAVVKAYADPVVADRPRQGRHQCRDHHAGRIRRLFRDEAKRWTTFYKESGIKLN